MRDQISKHLGPTWEPWDLLKYLEEHSRKPTPWNDEDDVLSEGLNNILVIKVRIKVIDELSKVSLDLINNPK